MLLLWEQGTGDAVAMGWEQGTGDAVAMGTKQEMLLLSEQGV
jgi:hypothetical protein